MNQQNSPDAKLGQNLPLLFTISLVAAITVFISCRVIFIVFVTSKNRFRFVLYETLLYMHANIIS